MSGARGMRHPERWVAVLRIGVGLWFLKSLFTKIVWSTAGGLLPMPSVSKRWIGFMPKKLAEFAAGNPQGWYVDFLHQVVLPNADLFARLTAVGEVVVGIGLTLGLFTEVAAAVGFFLALNYGLASYWQSPGEQGFHLVLLLSMAVFIGASAGRVWGTDGFLASFAARRRRATAPMPRPTRRLAPWPTGWRAGSNPPPEA
ncbi:MAG TPA: TQO small subunit DoxD [Longimicrobiaceae bacterium]|nr:TQO small subunit DoxD [Longimicrobiaceae bacterium]